MACLERLQVCRVVSPLAAPTARTPRSLLVSDEVTHTQEPAAAHRLRRLRGAVHATAPKAAHSDRTGRHLQVATTHFFPFPTRRACTCQWPFKGARGEGLLRPGKDERNFAEPIVRTCSVDNTVLISRTGLGAAPGVWWGCGARGAARAPRPRCAFERERGASWPTPEAARPLVVPEARGCAVRLRVHENILAA